MIRIDELHRILVAEVEPLALHFGRVVPSRADFSLPFVFGQEISGPSIETGVGTRPRLYSAAETVEIEVGAVVEGDTVQFVLNGRPYRYDVQDGDTPADVTDALETLVTANEYEGVTAAGVGAILTLTEIDFGGILEFELVGPATYEFTNLRAAYVHERVWKYLYAFNVFAADGLVNATEEMRRFLRALMLKSTTRELKTYGIGMRNVSVPTRADDPNNRDETRSVVTLEFVLRELFAEPAELLETPTIEMIIEAFPS